MSGGQLCWLRFGAGGDGDCEVEWWNGNEVRSRQNSTGESHLPCRIWGGRLHVSIGGGSWGHVLL